MSSGDAVEINAVCMCTCVTN